MKRICKNCLKKFISKTKTKRIEQVLVRTSTVHETCNICGELINSGNLIFYADAIDKWQ